MIRNGMTLLLALAMIFGSLLDQSAALAARQENANLVEFPEPIAIEQLASGLVGGDLTTQHTLVLERISLPAGGFVPARHVTSVEALYIEEGELMLMDSIGLTSTYGPGSSAFVRSTGVYEAENQGTDTVVYLRLRIAGAPVGTSSATPQPVPAETSQSSGDSEVAILAESGLLDVTGFSSLYLSRVTWEPGDTSGEFMLSQPLGVMTESGTITIASPSGLDGQLNEGGIVMLPPNEALTVRNDGTESVSTLMFGIAAYDQPGIFAAPPSATPPPLSGRSPKLAKAESSSPGVLYDAGESGGFENWPDGEGWRVESEMLVHDRREYSVIMAPFTPETADYAIEAEIQWTRHGGSFGVIGREVDGDGYQTGYVTSASNSREWIRFWGASNNSPAALANLELDSNWHLYRLELQGDTIRVYVDGNLVIETTDSSHKSPGKVGLWSTFAHISVRSFKVLSLDVGSVPASNNAEKIATTGLRHGEVHAIQQILVSTRQPLIGRAV